MLVDGAPRRFLDAGQNEVCHSPALQGSGMLDKALLVSSNPRLQTFSARPGGVGLYRRFGHHQFPYQKHVRPMAGKVNLAMMCAEAPQILPRNASIRV